MMGEVLQQSSIIDGAASMNHVIETSGLPVFPVGPDGSLAYILNGAQHGFAGMSLMLAELQPGEGPALHRHTYDEAFAIGQGRAAFTIDGAVIEAGSGQVVLVPAGMPHAFVNAGTELLKITAIHVAPKVEIEWLEPPWMPGD
jgi:mannose-6-phosphate isomerase-like protein (cupin superfamily)